MGVVRVADIRNFGLAAGLTIDALPGEPAKRPYEVAMRCLANGFYVRYGGDTIQLAPPFIVEKAEIDRLVSVLGDALNTTAWVGALNATDDPPSLRRARLIGSRLMSNRIPSVLAEAAKRGDVEATEAALATLSAGEPSLAALFSYATQLGWSPAGFAILHHVAMSEPGDASERREWLYALNNACAYGCTLGTHAQRTAIAERALTVAAENVSMFHNAACLFCVLDRPDDALACVRGAAEHDYEHMAKLADDSDLDLIRSLPEFAVLVGAKADIDRDERAQRLADLSRELFRGDPVPDELAAFWQEQWTPTGATMPEAIEHLHETRPAHLGRLAQWLEHPIAGARYRAVLDRIDLFADDADRRSKTFVGYYRGHARQLSLTESPIVEVCESGAIRVTARSLYEHLVIANHDRATQEITRVSSVRAHGRKTLDNILANADVDAPTIDAEAARVAARAITDAPLDDLARELADDDTASPALAALVAQCRDLDGDAPQRATFVELRMQPWMRGTLTRAGGPCVGVPDAARDAPISPLVHLLTLDVPHLVGDASARAVAVFVDVFHHARGPGYATARLALDHPTTILVTDASIAEHGEQSGPLDGAFQELPRARPVCVDVEIPARLLEDRARGLWGVVTPTSQDDGDALATRFLVWRDADALRIVAVPSAHAADERFFEALAKEYARAGFAIAFPAATDNTFGEWLKELERDVEDGPPESSPGGRRERYSTTADADRVELHKQVMDAWFEPAVAILAQLLAHPSTHVRTWTALSITDLFQDHVSYDMYSESVGDHFRSIAGDKLSTHVNPRQLVAGLIAAFPPPVPTYLERATSGDDDEDEYNHGTDVASLTDALVRAVLTLLHAGRKNPTTVLAATTDAVTFALDRFEAGDNSVVDLLLRLGRAVREHDAARAHLRPLVDARGKAALALPDTDPTRTAHHLFVYASFGDRRGIPLLQDLLARVDEPERATIADTLRELPAKSAVPALLEALPRATGRAARLAIVRALTMLDASTGPIVRADILARPLELERYKSFTDVMDAAIEAAHAGAAEARAFLVAMAERGQTDTAPMRALGALRATEAVPALLEIVTNGRDYDRGDALSALAAIGDPRAHDVLFAALVQRDNEWHIEHGARGMAHAPPTPAIIDALIAAAEHKNHLARIAALETIGDLGLTAGLAVAHANVDDGHSTIANTAAIAIQQLAPGSPEGVPPLLELMKHFRRDYERGHVDDQWKRYADRLVAALARAPSTPSADRLRAALAFYTK